MGVGLEGAERVLVAMGEAWGEWQTTRLIIELTREQFRNFPKEFLLLFRYIHYH